MRYYNVNIYLQQLVPVSFWALFIICFLAHFSITDPSVCPRVSFSSLCLFVFFLAEFVIVSKFGIQVVLVWHYIFCFWGDAASSSLSLCGCVSASASDAHSQVFWHFDILCFFVLISVWKAVLTLTSFTKITPEPMSTTTFDHCEHSPMSTTDRRAEKK